MVFITSVIACSTFEFSFFLFASKHINNNFFSGEILHNRSFTLSTRTSSLTIMPSRFIPSWPTRISSSLLLRFRVMYDSVRPSCVILNNELSLAIFRMRKRDEGLESDCLLHLSLELSGFDPCTIVR